MPLPIALRPGIANTARLRDAILSLQPTAYWPLDDGSGPLRELTGNPRWPATVTGSPTFGVALPSPIGRGITFSGSGQYATTSTSAPTPASSMSVLCIFASTDATGANRYILSRGAASQFSWGLLLSSTHAVQFTVFQSNAAAHATATVAPTGSNDGVLRLAMGTFDGTTVRGFASPGNLAGQSSTSLTGSWHKASTAGIQVGALNSGGTAAAFPGAVAHCAYWADRVLTHAEFRYIASIAQGG